jgi:hypothetical protein
MNVYLMLFAAIGLEVVGTMLLPASQNFTKIIPTFSFADILWGIFLLFGNCFSKTSSFSRICIVVWYWDIFYSNFELYFLQTSP